MAGNITITAKDVDRITRLTATEADHGLKKTHPEVYEKMVEAIVDTVVNRVASDDHPDSVRDVANYYKAFSAINGPTDRNYKVWGDVDSVPDSVVPSGLQDMIEEHLSNRAAGEASSVGGGLNYANPHYSDAKNLRWINDLDGPRIGVGKKVHYHGTESGTPTEAVLSAADDGSFTITGAKRGSEIDTPAGKQLVFGEPAAPGGYSGPAGRAPYSQSAYAGMSEEDKNRANKDLSSMLMDPNADPLERMMAMLMIIAFIGAAMSGDEELIAQVHEMMIDMFGGESADAARGYMAERMGQTPGSSSRGVSSGYAANSGYVPNGSDLGLTNDNGGLVFTSPVENGVISSLFGLRPKPLEGASGGGRPHNALDIAPMTAGDRVPIYAMAEGEVSFVGNRRGWGLTVEVTHANGHKTRYSHLDSVPSGFSVGDSVTRDSQIGRMGNSGLRGMGVHLDVTAYDASGNPYQPVIAGHESRDWTAESERENAFVTRTELASSRREQFLARHGISRGTSLAALQTLQEKRAAEQATSIARFDGMEIPDVERTRETYGSAKGTFDRGFMNTSQMSSIVIPDSVKAHANDNGWVMYSLAHEWGRNDAGAAAWKGETGFYNVNTKEIIRYPAQAGGVAGSEGVTNGPTPGSVTHDHHSTDADGFINNVFTGARVERNHRFGVPVIRIDDSVPGRDGFLIHQPLRRNQDQISAGCITLPPHLMERYIADMERTGAHNVVVLDPDVLKIAPAMERQVARLEREAAEKAHRQKAEVKQLQNVIMTTEAVEALGKTKLAEVQALGQQLNISDVGGDGIATQKVAALTGQETDSLAAALQQADAAGVAKESNTTVVGGENAELNEVHAQVDTLKQAAADVAKEKKSAQTVV